MPTTKPLILVGMFLLLSAGAGTAQSPEPADVVFFNGKIYTLVDGLSTVEAVAVRDGRVVYAGDRAGSRPLEGEKTQRVDLGGGTMIPGLVDAHAHLRSLGRYLAQLKLETTTSAAGVREMVRAAQKSTPPGRWIQGRGWDQNDWEVKQFPTHRDLDGTDTNPVYLRRVDGHASWVNGKAMEICGITRDTPDPEGGRIVRDKNGDPTGVFIDNASDLIADNIPDPTPEELDDWMLAAIRHCNKRGLTGIHDAGIDQDDLDSLERLFDRGELTFRVYCMLSTEDEDLAFAERTVRAGPRTTAGGRVVVRAIKLYADGALGSRGAAMIEPYSDDPGNRGLLVDPPEELERLARLALENGFQVCTHAIGDRGNRITLDVYEKVLSKHPGGRGEPRFRVEHAQIVSAYDIPRFARLGVVPSMQPTHCTSDMYWAQDRVGPDRVRGAYAWRSYLDDNNHMPLGSDFPVEAADPLLGIYAAVTRQDQKGWPEGGWFPEQRMTALEAVSGFTREAAWAGFQEADLGTIEEGKRADFTVLDRDILTGPPAEILKTRVTRTVVEGTVVYPRE
jgi:predicted amidohydrolase YtcJ